MVLYAVVEAGVGPGAKRRAWNAQNVRTLSWQMSKRFGRCCGRYVGLWMLDHFRSTSIALSVTHLVHRTTIPLQLLWCLHKRTERPSARGLEGVRG